MSINGLGGAGGVGTLNVSGMDIETAMMMIQSRRADLLESNLREQIGVVQSRNEQIGAKQEQTGVKRAEIQGLEDGIAVDQKKIAELQQMQARLSEVHDRDPNHWTGLSWGWAGDGKAESHAMLEQVRAEGLTDVGPTPRDVDDNGTMDAHPTTVKGWMNQIDEKIRALEDGIKTKETQIKTNRADIGTLQREMDSLSNTQQMEMLRLQSLSNKRNEAFDLMTNFVKKMQDNRSSIISNMR